MPAEATDPATARPSPDPIFAVGVQHLILLEIVAAIAVPFALGRLSAIVAIGILFVPVLYVAVVVVRTKDPLEAGRPMHAQDVALVRKSGPFAFLAVLVMAVAVVSLHLLGGDAAGRTDMQIAITRAVMCVVIGCAELSILFALICLWTPDDFGQFAPAVFWKVACIPLLLVLGFVVVGMAASRGFLRPSGRVIDVGTSHPAAGRGVSPRPAAIRPTTRAASTS